MNKIKGESKKRQSSSSTYHHTAIIIRWPQRCHDNTEGGEGEIWRHGWRKSGKRQCKEERGSYLV